MHIALLINPGDSHVNADLLTKRGDTARGSDMPLFINKAMALRNGDFF